VAKSFFEVIVVRFLAAGDVLLVADMFGWLVQGPEYLRKIMLVLGDQCQIPNRRGSSISRQQAHELNAVHPPAIFCIFNVHHPPLLLRTCDAVVFIDGGMGDFGGLQIDVRIVRFVVFWW